MPSCVSAATVSTSDPCGRKPDRQIHPAFDRPHLRKAAQSPSQEVDQERLALPIMRPHPLQAPHLFIPWPTAHATTNCIPERTGLSLLGLIARRRMTELALCPFCASSAVRMIGKRHARAIACENCNVEVRPPGWRQQTMPTSRHSGTDAGTPARTPLTHMLCPIAESNHGWRKINRQRICGKISRITVPSCFQISTVNGKTLEALQITCHDGVYASLCRSTSGAGNTR
jgi:hypothetical protein